MFYSWGGKMNKKAKESALSVALSTIFALFIGFVLFTSYEPTKKILMDFLGQLLTLFFIIVVVGIVLGIIWIFYYFNNN